MKIDGGANAIKGFNYQKAVITLIAIMNYSKKGFEVFLENQEDAEVIFEDSHTFIQIKGQKLSISSIKTFNSKNNPSILYKNLCKNSEKEARYKIVSYDFTSLDLKQLKETNENLIFDKAYKYSENQKKEIIESLKLEGFNESEACAKLSRSYLYFSPFKNDLKQAIPFLKGKMSENNINIDNNKGDIVINELFTQIDTRSEITPLNSDPYNSKKKLTYKDLNIIFQTIKGENLKEEILKRISKKLNFCIFDEERIKLEQLRIFSQHKNLKRLMIERIGCFNYKTEESKLISDLCNQVDEITTDKHIKYAIIIDIVAERMQEELSCL